MPSIIVRFPGGDKEFRFPDTPLTPGDLIAHHGKHYRVVSVRSHDGAAQTVTVEPADDLEDLLKSERGAITLAPL